MINNQLARRNLTDSWRRYFIGKRYEEEKKQGERRDLTYAQSEHKFKTAELIAKENNTSQATVRRNADYSKAIDIIKEQEPEIANKILTEEIKVNSKDVVEIADAELEERGRIIEEIGRGMSYKDVKKPHVSNNSGNNEWYTPVKILEIARSVMGSIDTDPASSEMANRNVKATTFYTEEDDGLKRDWAGNIWLNPPYAQPAIQNFSDKLIEEIKKGNVKQAMVLVNNATETK